LQLKQQWTIEEIFIFSNSSHLEWRAGLSDTNLMNRKMIGEAIYIRVSDKKIKFDSHETWKCAENSSIYRSKQSRRK
jgi:hypothetical protein